MHVFRNVHKCYKWHILNAIWTFLHEAFTFSLAPSDSNNNHHDWYLVRLDRFSDSLALGLGNLTGTREEKQTKYLCPPAPPYEHNYVYK